MGVERISVTTNRYEVHAENDALILKLKGRWQLADGIVSPSQVWPAVESANPARIRVDSSALAQWDSTLVCFLVALQTSCRDAGVELDLSDLPGGAIRLTNLATAVPAREGARRAPPSIGFLQSVGQQVNDGLRSAGEMLLFLGENVIALGRMVRGQSRYRVSDVMLVLQQCGPDALPIVTLIATLMGMILAFVGLVQLAQFGADVYVANLVAVAMVREMGGMMTGIIMAGRTGAAFAAQLGTMNVNDEIAAYRTIGIPPIEYLVLPRMIALIVAVPLLTIYANVIGMIGGAVACVALSDVTLLQFYTQIINSVNLVDWIGGLFKASVYGVIIAIAGCLRGMQCKKSAAAVGDAATSAVVTAIVFIVVSEAILTIVYTTLGI
jgi:phospholipid/cholesterol/gamma-HCH transport system permease protein